MEIKIYIFYTDVVRSNYSVWCIEHMKSFNLINLLLAMILHMFLLSPHPNLNQVAIVGEVSYHQPPECNNLQDSES